MRTRPVLLYDGDCGFCTSCVRFLERRVRPRADLVPWQKADLAALGVRAERVRREVVYVAPNGHVHGGAAAVAKILLRGGGTWSVLGGVLLLPGVRWAARAAYIVVSANRHRLPGGTPACAVGGCEAVPDGHGGTGEADGADGPASGGR